MQLYRRRRQKDRKQRRCRLSILIALRVSRWTLIIVVHPPWDGLNDTPLTPSDGEQCKEEKRQFDFGIYLETLIAICRPLKVTQCNGDAGFLGHYFSYRMAMPKTFTVKRSSWVGRHMILKGIHPLDT
jgi:hypothetical protein